MDELLVVLNKAQAFHGKLKDNSAAAVQGAGETTT